MRKFVTQLLAVGAISALSAATALATPINPINTNRPITPNQGDGPVGGMQTILNDIYGCTGCVDAISGQSQAGMWTLPGNSFGQTGPVMNFEFAGNAGTNTFGIWSGTDSTALTTAQIFNGPEAAGSSASVSWNAGDPNTAFISTFDQNHVFQGTITANINRYGFGFYLGTGAGNFYSVDMLNPNSSAQMLAYVNPQNDRWVFGFEDTLNGDRDFNDMVVSAESIDPVPEPGSMMLFGTGLFGLGGMIRRRLAKRA